MIATILISAALALVLGLIVRNLVLRRRRGGSSCGCGCSSCAASSMCHGEKER